MNQMLQQSTLMRQIRRVWLLVAFTIALGGMKSYGVLEIVHSHPFDPEIAHSYSACDLPAGEESNGPDSQSGSDEHSHWLLTAEDTAGTTTGCGFILRLVPDSGSYLPTRAEELEGPERPTDLLKRPPRLA